MSAFKSPLLMSSAAVRQLVCDICGQFYRSGWAVGTSGSAAIRFDNQIYTTPSGVSKESLVPEDIYVLDSDGNSIYTPPKKPHQSKPPKVSDSSVLFVKIMQLRTGTNCGLHSHSVAISVISELCRHSKEFRIKEQEMIKGIAGHGFFDELVVPIIDNTAFEYELTDALTDAITRYPKTYAVLVRNHGLYVWGETFEVAKRHIECLHYLFDVYIELHKCGVLPTVAHERKRNAEAVSAVDASARVPFAYKHYIFDIEGTTTPITFVKDVLFPFARAQLRPHLTANWDKEETKRDVEAIYVWATQELSGSAAQIPSASDATAAQIEFLTGFLEQQIDKDSKHGALKQLQGHMWKDGYEAGTLKSIVYEDVVQLFQQLSASARTVSIYSSGSRQAQHLLFRYSQAGDLRPHIRTYFDTAVGTKREARSYENILLTLGYDPSDRGSAARDEVLFVTDIAEEAEAAVSAGMSAVISVRPGNAPLPASAAAFRTFTSFEALP